MLIRITSFFILLIFQGCFVEDYWNIEPREVHPDCPEINILDIAFIDTPELKKPRGMNVDPQTQKLYVADEGANKIFIIADTVILNSVGGENNNCDNFPVASSDAAFAQPTDVAIGNNNNRFFIMDNNNELVKRVEGGVVSNFAGRIYFDFFKERDFENINSCDAELPDFRSIEVDENANIFIASYTLGVIHFITYDYNNQPTCQYDANDFVNRNKEFQNDDSELFNILDLDNMKISGLYYERQSTDLYVALSEEHKILVIKNPSTSSQTIDTVFDNLEYLPTDLVVDEDENVFFVDKAIDQIVYFNLSSPDDVYILGNSDLGFPDGYCLSQKSFPPNTIINPHGIALAQIEGKKVLYISQADQSRILKIILE